MFLCVGYAAGYIASLCCRSMVQISCARDSKSVTTKTYVSRWRCYALHFLRAK